MVLFVIFISFVSLWAKNLLVLIPPCEFSEREFSIVAESLKPYHRLIVASADTLLCAGDSGMTIKPDASIYNIDTMRYDILIMIGGVGSIYWADEERLVPIFNHFAKKGIVSFGISAIALARAGTLKGRKATTIRDRLAIKELKERGVRYQDKGVIRDGNIITARSPNRHFFRELARLLKER